MTISPPAPGAVDPSEAPSFGPQAALASFGQERLWFLEQMSTHASGYDVILALRFTGDLDVARLRRAWAAVVDANESLRTTLRHDGRELLQLVWPSVETPWTEETIAPGIDVLDVVREEALRRFDLERGPLHRLRLIRLAADHAVLVIALHHAICDGWSLGVLAREFMTAYAGDSAVTPSGLQYIDFAHWQREQLESGALDEQIAFWRERTAGVATVELPTDRPRSAQASGLGGSITFDVPAPSVARARAFAAAREGSLYMALLAAFDLVLARNGNTLDVTTGCAVANRVQPELEDVVGFFVNTVPIRVPLSTGDTVGSLFDRVRSAFVEAYANQEVPFERIVRESGQPRTAGRSPLFQHLLVLQNAPLGALHLPGVTVEVLDVPRVTASFDLTLSFVETGAGLRGRLEYAIDLFDEATAGDLARQVVDALDRAFVDPSLPIASLLGPTDDEREAARRSLARTATPVSAMPVPLRLRSLVDERPAAAAVIAGSRRLTLGELWAKANEAAGELGAEGDATSRRLLVAEAPSLETIAAMLGCWLAGGTCILLPAPASGSELAGRIALTGADRVLGNVPEGIARARPFRPTPGAAKGTAGGRTSVDPSAVALIVVDDDPLGPPLRSLTHAELGEALSALGGALPAGEPFHLAVVGSDAWSHLTPLAALLAGAVSHLLATEPELWSMLRDAAPWPERSLLLHVARGRSQLLAEVLPTIQRERQRALVIGPRGAEEESALAAAGAAVLVVDGHPAVHLGASLLRTPDRDGGWHAAVLPGTDVLIVDEAGAERVPGARGRVLVRAMGTPDAELRESGVHGRWTRSGNLAIDGTHPPRVRAERIALWRDRLRDGALRVELPLDEARSGRTLPDRAAVTRTVASALVDSLRAATGESGAGEAAAILGAFQIVIGRWSRSTDLAVGFAWSDGGRPAPALPVRATVGATDSLGDVIAVASRAIDAVRGAPVHPVDLAVSIDAAVAPQRALLSDVLHVHQTGRPGAERLVLSGFGPALERTAWSVPELPHDLVLESELLPDGALRLTLHHASPLIHPDSAARLLDHVTEVLRAAALEPATAARTVSLEPRDRVVEQLARWNATALEIPPGTVADWIDDRAAQHPDRTAIRCGDAELSYGQLVTQADALAAVLVDAAPPGTPAPVAIVMRRSPDLIVAQLAAWKAGLPYLPVDPRYPEERRRLLLEDAGVHLVVSDVAGVGDGALEVSGRSLRVLAPGGHRPAPRAARARPDDVAYVIYTSGSTGRPKGVCVAHRSVTSLFASVRVDPGLDESDVLAAVTTNAFDISVVELFLPLVVGARIELLTEAEVLDGRLLREALAARGATVLDATPSVWHLLETLGGAPESVRAWSTGEALPVPLARQLGRRHREVVNLYGPTETTVWSTLDHVRPRVDRVDIGRPVANTSIYVLDEQLEPVPPGIPGELFIGGRGVAVGYLGRPDLTAEKFVPDPFAGAPGARMYRTGDIGRHRHDGTLECFGRNDGQVKIRGYRIELGEIESRLAELPGVREAHVMVSDRGAEREIVAFAGGIAAEGANGPLLREALGQRLPGFMVPTTIVVLDALPRLANGKLDRVALAGLARARVSEDHGAPADAIEATLCEAFASILSLPRVGPTDDFFALGGHSLSAVHLCAAIASATGVTIPVRDVFLTPTVRGLAARVRADSGATAALPPVTRTEEEVASFAEERMWFLQRFAPEDAAYNLAATLELRGSVDPSLLGAVVRELLGRHEILRTCYPERDGLPVPALQPVPDDALAQIDARGAAEGAAERGAAIGRELASRPFALDRAIPFRAVLVQTADDRYLLHFVVHHVACDGWSLAVLSADLTALLDAMAAGRPLPAPPPVRYRDFAAWQRHLLTPEIVEREVTHWRSILAEADQRAELPADVGGAGAASSAGQVPIEIPPALVAGLRRACSEVRATLFTGVLAAMHAAVAAHAGNDDVILGTPVAGRLTGDVEGVVGCFVNTLAVRARVHRAGTPRELLATVRDALTTALEHQALPFERLIDSLGVERTVDRSPVFQAMVALGVQRPPVRIGGVEVREVRQPMANVQLDVVLQLEELADGSMSGALVYREARFEHASMAALATTLRAVLSAFVETPDVPVRRAWSPATVGRSAILGDLGAWEAPTVPSVIVARCEAQPDEPALGQEDVVVSRRELLARARRLAHRLVTAGVRPGDVVALHLGRCPEAFAGMIGAWLARAAYLLIPDDVPAERARFMVDDASARVVVTFASADDWAGYEHLHASDVEGPEHHGQPSRPDDLAYVLYTSGTTGRPKGVAVPHGPLANYMRWFTRAFPFDTRTRSLLKMSLGFDGTLTEVWPALMVGGYLALARPGAERDAEEVVAEIVAHRPTHVTFVPAQIPGILQAGLHRCTSLETIFVGGEALRWDVVAEIRAALPVAVHNIYGPTEACIGVTTHPAGPTPDRPTASVPIGRFIDGVHGLVLDHDGEPVPPLGVGELHVGGQCLAWGYLGRAAETAAAFVPSPHGPPGARLYRTGDMVRELPDGSLLYLGRRDRQVKIRGQRIEIAEVEAAVRELSGVGDVAVEVRGGQRGAPFLAAFIAAEPDALDVGALRMSLAERLTPAMMPAAFVRIDRMPMTASGKVDRAALPDVVLEGTGGGEVLEGLEAKVAEVLEEVLGVTRVGRGDDFFRLGGSSLLATKVVARIASRLGVRLPLRTVFERSDVPGLAAAVGDALRQGTASAALAGLGAAPASGDRSEAPLTSFQERLWFLQQLDPATSAYHIEGTVVLRGRLDVGALIATCRELVVRHPAMRTVFPVRDDVPVQRVLPEMNGVVDVVSTGRSTPALEDAEVVEHIAAARARRFDLATGPLFKITVFHTAGREHALHLVAHHLVSDGWSIGVLVRDLVALYAAAHARTTPPLAPLSVDFTDYARWERSKPERDLEDRRWFEEFLRGAPPVLQLPTDHPRPTVPRFAGSSVETTLDPQTVEDVARTATSQGATPFMVLLSVFAAQLARLAGVDDLLVAVPVANRASEALEGVVGCFVNVLPIRMRFDSARDLHATIRDAREALIGALSHQGLRFEALVDALQVPRDPSRPPLVQVAFNMVEEELGAELDDLVIEAVPQAMDASKFDATLYVRVDRGRHHLQLAYSEALFTRARAEEMLAQFRQLLVLSLRAPSTPILAHSMVTPSFAGRAPEVSAPARSQSGTLSLADVLTSSFRDHADRVALVAEDERITYEQLERRAGAVAQTLIEAGVTRSDRVAITAPRGVELVVGVLGIVLSGAAFVILDPAYPVARNARILAIAEPAAVLHAGSDATPLRDALEVGREPLWIALTTLPAAGAAPPGRIPAEADAYLAFTSGTTGQPQGIVGTHAPVTHFLEWAARSFGLGHEARFALLGGLSHDPFLRDLFLPLSLGASLHVPPQDVMGSPTRLFHWLRRSGADVLHLTPSLAETIALGAGHDETLGATWMFFAGEPLRASTVRTARALAPRCRFVNYYGATETPQAMGSHLVTEDDLVRTSVPVGRGIDDVDLLVMTEAGELAGVGELGEVVVRTANLARGYVAGTRLDGKFAQHLPGRAGGDRVFWTGDLGRYLPDGVVEVVGRRDGQMKVRGHRIEPAEVEAALRSTGHVADAVCLADGDTLFAFVVARGPGASTSALRGALGELLPRHMVPDRIVALEAIPKTANFKVDRGRLLAAAAERTEGRIKRAPVDALERAVCAEWAKVLGATDVHLDDDFFELGGQSLVAARLLAAVRHRFGVELTLRRFLARSDVASMVEAIRSAKPGGTGEASVVLQPRPDEAHLPFPLTDVQAAYWVGRRGDFELGNVSTHAYVEIQTRALDLPRLEEALARVIARHDVLRLVVGEDGLQRVLPEVGRYRIQVQDLREVADDARAAGLDRIRREMSHQVLPLDRWPIFDVRISRLDDSTDRIHLSVDAMILDAFSRGLVARDVLRAYADITRELPPLAIGFRDYVVAAREAERGPGWDAARRYWEARLDDFPGAPELPLRRSPDTIAAPEFKAHTAVLDPERWTNLQRAAARRGLTGSTVLLAAYAEVLATWSASPRFGLNVTLFHRLPVHPQVLEIAGDFTTLEILDVDRAAAPDFRGFAASVQSRLWEDLDHAIFSGVRVLRELRARRPTAGALMPVVFTSTLGLGDGADPSAAGFEQVFAVSQTPQVWLDNIVSESAAGALEVRWNAVHALFPEGLIDDMFEGFIELLEDLSRDGERWTAERIHALPARERRLRDAVNATEVARTPKMLHGDALQAMVRTPDLTAVAWSGGSLTHEELGRRVGALHRRLATAGLSAGEPVAIVLEKGWRQVAAVLAILAAGGAYVPLDPNLPPDRIEHVLATTGARVAITEQRSRAALTSDLVTWIVEDELEGAPPPPPPPVGDVGQLAYIIFTSGSTGRPKGVMIDHRGATNTIDDLNARFAVRPDDRVFAISSLGFDLSVYDIFGLLGASGALVMPDPDGLREVGHWAELVRAHRVTIWNSVPALMQLYVEYLERHPEQVPTTLRLVMMSGDWVPVTLPDRIRALMPDCSIISLGGATEASIWSILHPIGEVDVTAPSIPYGKPMENQTFWVLDGRLLPRPTWVAGELYIGGIGVAMGYWADRERTADQFIIHPDTGERLYRTGDWGRWLPGGDIEFLGRQDGQVKIQGYRVELGEIESAARDLDLGGSVVAFAVGPRERRRLVLALADGGAAPLDVGAIKKSLGQRLPAYMVPHQVMRVDRLPLSSNGKVDRGALAKIVVDEPVGETAAAVAPAQPSPLEREITEVLEAVLGLQIPTSESNLLELGADSVGIIRAANRLEEKFGVRPRLGDVYRDPTVRCLARLYTAAAAAPAPTAPAATVSAPTPAPRLITDPADRDAFKARRQETLRAEPRTWIALDEPPSDPERFRRRSVRRFAPTPVPRASFAATLSGGAAVIEDGTVRFAYASAGGLYPIAIYVHVVAGRVANVDGGLYRYDPVRRALVPIAPGLVVDPLVFDPLLNMPIVVTAAFLTFLVSEDRVIRPMYGDKAGPFAAIEAGLVSGEMERRGLPAGVGCCHLGGLAFDVIRPSFGLAPDDVLVHTLAWGTPDDEAGPTVEGHAGPETGTDEREILEL